MKNSQQTIVTSYIEDGHVLECHVDLFPGERGERQNGVQITPDMVPEAEVWAVRYKGVDVTFLCSEELLDAIGDHALTGK
jgi:hypothetical protein